MIQIRGIKQLLTTREVAEELGWFTEEGEPDILKVQREIKKGRIKADRKGWFYLVPREEVDRVREEQEKEQGGGGDS